MIYWEYELAGVIYKTIIECKDYTSKISIDKIDALIGKIRDIPDIKPIFATKTGYQSGAEQKAKYNKIELLVVREQTDDDWRDENGNPFIKEIHIDISIQYPVEIKSFLPSINKEWVEKNTNIDISKPISINIMNNEIFIIDKKKNEHYSLFDLSQKLTSLENKEYGNKSKIVELEDAYIEWNDIILKIDRYKVDYYISKPNSMPMIIDFSKELIGVIEYISKGTNTAIFKDKIIKNWNNKKSI